MSIEQKAKELAEAVKETEEYKNLNSAHARLKLDVAAQDLISKIQKLQEDVHRAQMEGQPVDNAKVDEMKALHVSAGQNETISRLFKSQETFNNLMQSISEKISQELYK
ncbi:YlbF family regulator [Desulfitibacter alkalitolerans]|uniref:YlbF family regulator n=1 Tax=Desulfitibacter alkalitolerans TaxID=264641 RepID=UPI000480BD75|nr:YlbF family regulator [Desulfitibacter alkalitolerans]